MELYEERGLERHCQHPLLHHRALNVVVLVIIVVIVTTVLLITNMIEIFEKIKGGLKSIACPSLSCPFGRTPPLTMFDNNGIYF